MSMVVTHDKLKIGQTITIYRGGKRLGHGEIIERESGHILLVEIQRGGRLIQRVPLEGQEKYTLSKSI